MVQHGHPGPALLVIAVTALAAGTAPAQTIAPPPARGIYSDSQAARGAQVFRRVCADCHVASQFTSPAFRGAWSGRAVSELFELVRSTMPQDNPGRLRRQEYADVLAYVFKLNGMPAGTAELLPQPDVLRQATFDTTAAPRR